MKSLTSPSPTVWAAFSLLLLGLATLSFVTPAQAQTNQVTAAQVARDMQHWLKLNAAQTAQITPLIDTYTTQVALAVNKEMVRDSIKLFLSTCSPANNEFNASIAAILTQPQMQVLNGIENQLKASLAGAIASKVVGKLYNLLQLSNGQASQIITTITSPLIEAQNFIQKYAEQDPDSMGYFPKQRANREINGIRNDLNSAVTNNLSSFQATIFNNFSSGQQGLPGI